LIGGYHRPSGPCRHPAARSGTATGYRPRARGRWLSLPGPMPGARLDATSREGFVL
jgi:hypothetical protein